MKKVMILATTLIALSAQAHAANLTGTWTGSGTAVDHEGKNIACESVVLKITHTATSFSVNSEFNCSGNAVALPGATMEIKGNEIFDKGVKAGTISDSSISLVAKDKTFIMQTNASFTDKAMNLNSVISAVKNPGTPVLKFTSALKR